MGDVAAFTNISPLQKLTHIAHSSAEGFRRGLEWLSLFACSGVDIPLSTFQELASEAWRFQASLTDCITLVKACLYSSWLRSIGRQDLQATIATLLVYLEPEILSNIRLRENMGET